MTVLLKKSTTDSIPLLVVDPASFDKAQAALPAAQRPTPMLLPGDDGRLAAVWAGVRAVDHPWALALLPRALPVGRYHLADGGLALDATAAALSWQLGSYVFDRYKARPRPAAELLLPPGTAAQRGLMLAQAMTLVRDLVNTPAEHMGPAELADAAPGRGQGSMARASSQVVGDALLKKNFPAIHAVGRAADGARAAADRAELGQAQGPALTLVGKGVCFDSGGLDIKGADGMRLMKKDMGGAANALGLAQMIMALQLPVRLQLLIPAVENAIAGNAYRPGDVFKTRKGVHIEIGNTDAEGRVILCDALAYGAESQARADDRPGHADRCRAGGAGPQLPALFCRAWTWRATWSTSGLALHDPLWHLPLWRDYHGGIESDIADIVNTGADRWPAPSTPRCSWTTSCPPAWTGCTSTCLPGTTARGPGRPVGGEAQTLRTLLAYLEQRYGPARAHGRRLGLWRGGPPTSVGGRCVTAARGRGGRPGAMPRVCRPRPSACAAEGPRTRCGRDGGIRARGTGAGGGHLAAGTPFPGRVDGAGRGAQPR
jgi:leucyl aminopeptidase